MEFTTPVSVKDEKPKIDYSSKILLLGSCFAENIAEKFDYFKIRNFSNPFGILYHPAAIERLILNSLQNFEYTEKDIFQRNGIWHCYDAHSRLSNLNKEQLLKELNLQLKNTKEYLEQATHLIITLGTARVYNLKTSGKPVANCHKMPQKEFVKELLSISEIKKCLFTIISEVKKVNPSIHLIFTVSPIRHVRDGLIENSISKAHLLSAVNEVIGEGKFSYFPSYEIMIDELRDYRFYADDLIHPSKMAIEFIWEKFVKSRFSSEGISLLKKVEKVQKAISHKPFNKDSESHKKFRENLKIQTKILEEQIPYLSFSKDFTYK